MIRRSSASPRNPVIGGTLDDQASPGKVDRPHRYPKEALNCRGVPAGASTGHITATTPVGTAIRAKSFKVVA